MSNASNVREENCRWMIAAVTDGAAGSHHVTRVVNVLTLDFNPKWQEKLEKSAWLGPVGPVMLPDLKV